MTDENAFVRVFLNNCTPMAYKLINILFFFFALLLPLQTRYIFVTGVREYGTIALYLTDLLFLMLVILSPFFKKNNWSLVGAWAFGLAVLFWSHGQIEWYWWLRLGEALTVAYLIYTLPVLRTVLLGGLVLGAGLSSLLAIWQFYAQQIMAHSWFGLAAQAPWASGVSVLENMSGRLLRSYGPFPHPNILGGYVALVLLAAMARPEDFTKIFPSRWWQGAMFGLMTTGVFLSFSRSAALVLMIGLIWLFFEKKITKKTVLSLTALFIILNIVFFQFTLGRVLADNRLEEMSKNQRVAGVKIALEIIKTHPWLGVGLGQFTNSAALLLSNHDPRYIEPVHNIYLLIASELGLVGLALIVLCLAGLRRRRTLDCFALAVAIVTLGMLDHYLWTINSPRLLLALLFPLVLFTKKESAQGN